MLNKNFSISKKYYQYVKGYHNFKTINFNDLDQYYQQVINQILSTFPHQDQIEMVIRPSGTDISVFIKLPLLVTYNQTYYLSEGYFDYVISKEEGIVYNNCSVLRTNGLSCKYYSPSTIMRFHKNYNEYINQKIVG